MSTDLTISTDKIQPDSAVQRRYSDYEKKFSKNPGTFEKFHDKVRDVFPSITFDGGMCSVNFALSQYMRHSHTFNLSQLQPPGYRFGLLYVGKQKYSETDVFPVVLGDMDPSGNLNAQIIHQPHESWRFKFVSQIENGRMKNSNFAHEFRTPTATAGAALGNLELAADQMNFSLDYVQSIGQGIAVGTQLLYLRSPNFPGQQTSVFSLAARYSWGEAVKQRLRQVSMQISPLKLLGQLGYYRQIAAGLSLASELHWSHADRQAVAALGYHYEIPSAGVNFKTRVDSQMFVESLLEKRIPGTPLTLALSAQLHHRKKVYRMGIGLTFG